MPASRARERISRVAAWALSRLGVLRNASEIHRDAGLVAQRPGIVARGDRSDVTGTDLGFGAIRHHDLHPPRDAIEQVLGLTTVRPGDGLDMRRPLPPRLERAIEDRVPADVDDRRVALLLEGTPLFGGLHVLDFNPSHLMLLLFMGHLSGAANEIRVSPFRRSHHIFLPRLSYRLACPNAFQVLFLSHAPCPGTCVRKAHNAQQLPEGPALPGNVGMAIEPQPLDPAFVRVLDHSRLSLPEADRRSF